MGRLFGTDGARGVANTELSCELAMQIGRAAAIEIAKHAGERPKILIGQDTRISSDMLKAALVAGLCSVGADALLLDVVPTPAVAYLVKKYNADAGIMISASHNPVEFNGIKLFDRDGYKLPDEIEEKIEALIFDTPEKVALKEGISLGRVVTLENAIDDYIDHIARSVGGRLSGLRIAVDCANGSASRTAGKLFETLGADAVFLSDKPDGTNINENCGSTHLDNLCKFVKENRCHAGVAFDGDADRCLAVDEKGNVVDGDKMLAIFAKNMKENGTLKNNTIVVTVMSNLGFFRFAEDHEIETVKTKVGDRYVLEEMRKEGHVIGGEQSGHIIFSDFATTGDGQLSAGMLLKILKDTNLPFSELASVMDIYPQVLLGIEAGSEGKAKLDTDDEIIGSIRRVEEKLGENGRVLVRASGTEPLIRVMLEGKDIGDITLYANEICNVIKGRL